MAGEYNPIKAYIAVEVDFTKSRQKLIDEGDYFYADPRFTRGDFSVSGSGKGEVKVIIISFQERLTTEELLELMKQSKLRPINLRELLEVGRQFPNLQLNFPIVALGSTVWESGDFKYVGALTQSKNQRLLGMYPLVPQFAWKQTFCFGAVQLQSS